MSATLLMRVVAPAGALIVATIAVSGRTTLTESASAAARISQSRSVWTGVYTKEQADRGRRLYVRDCAECHAQNLMGAEGGTALVGEVFLGPWLEHTVGDLYELTQSTMPDSAPGVLAARQYADLIAYLLSENGFPAGGEELPVDLAALKQIRIEPRPQP